MSTSPSRRLALLTVFILALTLGLGFATLCAVLGGLAWPLELFANFHPQWAALSLVLFLAALLLRHRPLIVVNAVLFAANAVPLYPHLMSYLREPAAVEASGATLRLLSLNMHAGATDDAKFQALVAVEKPDVILLTEMPSDITLRMRALQEAYPHRVMGQYAAMHDVGIYSRWPIAAVETSRAANVNLPVTAADLCPPAGERGACLRVVALHAMTPFAQGFAQRERQFDIAARQSALNPGPSVIIGDLNLTPWSPTFARFIERARLQDTSRMRGLQPTWQSAQLPAGIAPLFALSIDQALVSEDVAARASRVGPDVGSDHRPIIVDLQLPNLAQPAMGPRF